MLILIRKTLQTIYSECVKYCTNLFSYIKNYIISVSKPLKKDLNPRPSEGILKLTEIVKNKDNSVSRFLVCINCTPLNFLTSKEYIELTDYLKKTLLKSPKGITLLCTLVGKSGDKVIQSSFNYSKLLVTYVDSVDSIDKLTHFISTKRDSYNLDYILLLKIRLYKH